MAIPLDIDAAALGTKPWNSITYGIPPHLKSIPTMLTDEEGRMLRWITEFYYSGRGAICELGTFVGGSTARLAFGLTSNKRAKGIIECFDRYECREDMKQQLLYKNGIERFEGEDILPLAERLLARFSAVIRLHKCDILDVTWNGGPIEILFVDIAKTVKVVEHLAAVFYPHLIPGRSIVVQQDYFHYRNPWIAGQMEVMSEYFELAGYTEHNSAIFLCRKAIPQGWVAERSWGSMDVSERLEVIAPALNNFPYRRQREYLAECMIAVRDNPAAVSSWQIGQVKRNSAVIEQCLADADARNSVGSSSPK